MSSQEDDNGKVTIGKLFLKWGHWSATITIAIFLWTQWQTLSKDRDLMDINSAKENAEMRKELALNKAAIDSLRQSSEHSDMATISLLNNFKDRMEIQRQDIRELQSEIFQHIGKDEIRFKGLGR